MPHAGRITRQDVSQTDPLPGTEPVPLAPPAQPIEGDSHADLVAPLQELARELGYRVEIRDLPDYGPGGWCDHKHKQIVVGLLADSRAARRIRRLPAKCCLPDGRAPESCGMVQG